MWELRRTGWFGFSCAMRMMRATDAHVAVGNSENFTTLAKGGTFIAPSAGERSHTASAKLGTTAPSISGCC